MKKAPVALLVFLLLLTIGLPAWAAGHSDTAMAYLMEKYDVAAERIELHEGGTLLLEHLGESFWFAKYFIAPEGMEPIKQGEQKDPDTPVSDLPRDLGPLPALPDGYIYGGLYIREKTGEILTSDKMDAYFLKDRQLAQAEWEKLSKEAGKLEVFLYKKLQGLSSSQKVKILIFPTFTMTEALQEKYDALKDKYPQLNLAPDDLHFFRQHGSILPVEIDNLSQNEGSTPSEGGGGEPGFPGGKGDYRSLPDVYRKDYEAFQLELNAIRMEGLAPAISAIASKLNAMGVSYEDFGYYLAGEATVSQIKEISTLASVESVSENVVYTALDADGRETAAPPLGGRNAGSGSKYALWLLPLILGIVFLYFKRRQPQS
jgi:hypothetical protein